MSAFARCNQHLVAGRRPPAADEEKCILRSHFLKLGAGFVRSGDVVPSTYYPNAAISVAGATGTYWSKRVMFYMVFTDSDVLPNVSHHKYMGFSLRCLAIE